MDDQLPKCPVCDADFTYEMGALYNCPSCGHEWSKAVAAALEEDANDVVKDANGTILKDGDTVSLIKDLKIKGSSQVIKVGTQAKNIRLISGDHNIDCKLPDFGPMKLKSEFVKKVN